MPLDDVIFRSSISCDTCLSAAVVVLGHYTIDTCRGQCQAQHVSSPTDCPSTSSNRPAGPPPPSVDVDRWFAWLPPYIHRHKKVYYFLTQDAMPTPPLAAFAKA